MKPNDSDFVAKDPVCGLTVDEKTDLYIEREGKKVYFCTDHCRQKYLTTSEESRSEDRPEGS